MRGGLKLAILASAALLTGAAAPKGGWSNQVVRAPTGQHLLGNPAAEVVLTEYVSYTCASCVTYNIESDAVLKLAYVPSGRVAVAVQLLADSPVELATAMLASCGPKERFFLNHNVLLRSQPKWLPLVSRMTPSQRQRWNNPNLGTRNRAIAADLGLYAVMATRGYDRQSVERCLNDQALAAQISAGSAAAHAAGVLHAPGFAIGGKLLENTADWAGLRPQLDESLK